MALIKPVKGISPQFGDNCYLAENAVIVGDVVMGADCSVWFHAVIRGDVNAIRMGDKVNVQDGAIIHCTYLKAATTIGNNVSIGEFAYLGGGGGLEIGDECIIGQYLSCHPENHVSSDLTIAIRFQDVTRRGIKIGKNCWLGSKVTILDGVELGDGCIVAAGAVVNKSFPPNSIIGGLPAKLIKTRI